MREQRRGAALVLAVLQQRIAAARGVVRHGAEQASQLVGAVAVELTPEDQREIDGAASKIAIQGDRYPEALEKRTGL